MNKTDIAKLAANLTVAAVTRKLVRETAQQHTNTPDILVEVGSGVAGAVISDKLSPYTEALIDDVTSKIRSFRHKNN